MIKMRGNIDGGEVLILGLSQENLDRMRADWPDGGIRVKGAEVGLPCDVYIVAAPTDEVLFQQFKHLVGPDTKVHVSPKLKN